MSARRFVMLGAVAWCALLGTNAAAHEVLHSVERGRAIAVKAFFADGEALAYGEYQVFSPADSKIPYQKGRTDRSGYLAFVPDVAGRWSIRVLDATGHGLDIAVEAGAADVGSAERAQDHAPAARPTGGGSTSAGHAHDGDHAHPQHTHEHDADHAHPDASAPPAWMFLARPILGTAIIALIFLTLWLVYRRRGERKP